MSTLEDRLSAALAARAELVQPEDLRPAEPPVTRRSWTRPVLYGLAAAACAAAIAAPFVVGGLGGDGADRPAPPVASTTATPSPSPTAPETPSGSDVPGAGWTEAYTYPRAYDVDADGTPDEVVVRTEGNEKLPPGVRRVEVHLSTGGVAAVLLDYDTYDLTMIEPVEVDGRPGDEILYYRGTESEEIGLLRYAEGALVDLRVPGDPGLTSAPDARFRSRGWWTEDRRLFSYRTVDGGFVPGSSNASPPPYEVDIWRWDVGPDGRLAATPMPSGCYDPTVEQTPSAC